MTGLTNVEVSKLELTEGSLSTFERFQIRTVPSIGPPELKELHETEIYPLMFKV